jgi:hypothetical protein
MTLPLAVLIAVGAIGGSPCLAQTRLTTLAELRNDLAAGDFVTVAPASGQPVRGRLLRLDDDDLVVRIADKRLRGNRRDVAIPLNTIRSLERPRDSARNGAAIGAVTGAGFAGALFFHALAIDRNEIDEWAWSYAGAAAVCTGMGALIGWGIDAARSKPHIRFDAPLVSRTKVSVQPLYAPRRGIGISVLLSR